MCRRPDSRDHDGEDDQKLTDKKLGCGLFLVPSHARYGHRSFEPKVRQNAEIANRAYLRSLTLMLEKIPVQRRATQRIVHFNRLLADIPQIASRFAEIILPCHRRGNGIISAATR